MIMLSTHTESHDDCVMVMTVPYHNLNGTSLIDFEASNIFSCAPILYYLSL